MKAVIQRVRSASVSIDDVTTASIGRGLLVLLGISNTDSLSTAAWMAEKILALRVFDDEEGRLNLSVGDVGGAVLAVSQFTLYGDATKGTRPSFVKAAASVVALPIYHHFIQALQNKTPNVSTGTFGAMMDVSVVNDGPVTILLERD